MAISTRNLDGLGDIPHFRRVARALATLDAVLSPEWADRYYSFNSRWGESEMMASMLNGSGDHWFAVLSSAGAALLGLSHEAPVFQPGSPWPGIYDGLPPEFHANLLHEPAFTSEHVTFCIWRLAGADHWSTGPVQLPQHEDPDGSAELLSIFAGDPQQYMDFAAEYYDRELDVAVVAAVYQHQPLTYELVRRLNPAVHLDSLRPDLDEIGYPETW
jgi:hypothetical protein